MKKWSKPELRALGTNMTEYAGYAGWFFIPVCKPVKPDKPSKPPCTPGNDTPDDDFDS